VHPIIIQVLADEGRLKAATSSSALRRPPAKTPEAGEQKEILASRQVLVERRELPRPQAPDAVP
jgi:hypothetical protein